ncbi:nucleotide sugar dehydrogenase [Neptuniibacter sp. CAU 1671]|uniref:nucleotide sugar dehydrogenase n=1 Tax=Neptuniibacter sp. CAU 1671 TaxID=3032593 RepID=UPI0023DB1777|nr:nucleotide sugar dehydrogenase [Neptuniibacter sp. CAU 1671]MDF2181513.1 nucleotide sugar dehydrogenase [Neptuniibacter sp. CAU 1671]
MKITVWGNQLLAWVAAAALAESGNVVALVADQTRTLDELLSKTANEPGLSQLIAESYESGRLSLATEQAGLENTLHLFALNPDQYETACLLAQKLADKHKQQLLIINQSNFGVGSSDKLQAFLKPQAQQHVAYIPDMLAEGTALRNYKYPDTLIIGCEDDWGQMSLKALLRPFSKNLKQWMVMSSREAEFTKFANTGMLALRLGYINELANLADKLGVDIEAIRDALITDPRIGPHYLHPGCGFGGLNFQQYIEALAELMLESRSSKLLETVLTENEKQKELPFRKLWRHYNCNLEGRTISLWGLSYKPGTPSIDHAPSLKIISTLLAQGCIVRAHDPQALPLIQEKFPDEPNLVLCADNYEALNNSDALLLLTEWPEYSSPLFDQMHARMAQPLIIDGRNLLDKPLAQSLGFTYYGIGR